MDGLHGVAFVQRVTKIEVLSVYQQAVVGGDLSHQLDPDVHQGLPHLGLVLPFCANLGQLQLQVQQDPLQLLSLHSTASASLRLFSNFAFRFLIYSWWVSKDWAVHFSSLSIISAAPISVAYTVTTVVFSSVFLDQYLSSSSGFF